MILRRISQGIRKQDWFVVIVEIMIVVVGIFIGLQVDDWNEKRKQRTQELVYLSQLKEDVTTMKLLVNGLIANEDGLPEAMMRVLRVLETCSADPASESDFQRTFTEYQNILTVQVLDATFNEMLASGALARLRYPDLKRALPEMFAQLNRFNQTVPQIRGALPTIDQIVWERVRLTYDNQGQIALNEYDIDLMCDSPRVQNAVVEMIDGHRDWGLLVSRAAERISRVEAQLLNITGSLASSD
jgi:Family of unknown function (DUF6090)